MRDKTRRFWTTLLFFLLGPACLVAAAWRLYWRGSESAMREEEARISRRLGCDVRFDRRDSVAPDVVRFINLELSVAPTNEPLLFAPEAYVVKLRDVSLTRSFIESFERSEEEQKSVARRDDRFLNDSFSLSSATDDELSAAVFFYAPEILCRYDQLGLVKNEIETRFYNAFVGKNERGVACFVVDKIQATLELDGEDRSQRIEESASAPLKRRKLEEAFRTAAFQTPRGNGGLTAADVNNEVVAFSSEPPTFEKCRAVLWQNENVKKLDALFEIGKISAQSPYHLSFEKQTDGRASFVFDARRSPVPGVLASTFFPRFRFLGREGWFCGNIAASNASDFGSEFFSEDDPARPNADAWTCRISNLHLRNFNLQELAEDAGTSLLSGSVVDLSIRDGATRNGIALGRGAVKARNVVVPASWLRRLCAQGTLELAPREASSLRFINDAAPFNELELQFSLEENGISLDSQYPNKIAAYYNQDSVRYGAYLNRSTAGETRDYEEILSAFVDANDPRSIWSPIARCALNRLPIAKAPSKKTPITKTARGGDERAATR